MKQCGVNGCGRRYFCKGYCRSHYRRWHQGDLNRPIVLKREGDPTPEFFKKFSVVDAVTGCWNWIRGMYGDGYGHIQVNGMAMHASRASFIASNGPVEKGLLVCHKCDNRRCVNPDHLFLGTNQDNQDDMHAKGRARYLCGEENPNSKLNKEQVVAIRSDPRIHRLIAADYGVSRRLVGKIKQGLRWKM